MHDGYLEFLGDLDRPRFSCMIELRHVPRSRGKLPICESREVKTVRKWSGIEKRVQRTPSRVNYWWCHWQVRVTIFIHCCSSAPIDLSFFLLYMYLSTYLRAYLLRVFMARVCSDYIQTTIENISLWNFVWEFVHLFRDFLLICGLEIGLLLLAYLHDHLHYRISADWLSLSLGMTR